MTDFRKVYPTLTDEQKSRMETIKDMAQNLDDKMTWYVPAEERSDRARMMNVAKTNLEQAIMWAVKAITA